MEIGKDVLAYSCDDTESRTNYLSEWEANRLSVDLSVLCLEIPCEIWNCDEKGGVGTHDGIKLSDETPGRRRL